MRGSLDFVNEKSIEGWVYDENKPESKIFVEVLVNGYVAWKGLADAFRQDLALAGIGDGSFAFFADVEAVMKGYNAEAVEVRAVAPELELELERSPWNLMVGTVKRENRSPVPSAMSHEHTVADPFVAQPSNQSQEVINTKSSTVDYDFVGSLDDVDAFTIRGWSFCPGKPEFPVSIDIVSDSRLIARIDASDFRQDLKDAMIGGGYHSFSYPTPVGILDGRDHVIRAFVTNTNIMLSRSPTTVRLENSISYQMFSYIQDAIRKSADTINLLQTSMSGGFSGQLRVNQSVSSLYFQWQKKFGCLSGEDRVKMMREMLLFPSFPLLSVVMPTYNTPKDMLEASINSVISQIYYNWELIIVDDASKPEMCHHLRSLAALDARIRLILRAENGHISAATNTGIENCIGDYIGFLDHDDLLSEDALYQVVSCINKKDPDLVYSDEDKIDRRGVFVDPHFKPDYNYTLLLSYNYICHFVVIKRDIIEKAGRLSLEHVGAQDYDYILRCCEVSDPSRISHIPMILYHWRSHDGSTASSIDVKNYAAEAGLRAVSDHLKRSEQSASATLLGHSIRVQRLVPKPTPTVSIVIPTRDCARILSVCMTGLLTQTDYENIEIVIVDNGSVEQETLDLFKELRKDKRVIIVRFDGEFNYSAICNFGVTYCTGRFVLMLNNDIEILESDWLREMVSEISVIGVGAVGAKLFYPDGRIQHAGVILGIGGVAGHAHKFSSESDLGYMNRLNVVQEFSACTAACLLLRRDVFDRVGGFDVDHLGVAFNDVDLCLKIGKLGFKVVFTPFARLRHHESVSRGSDVSPAKSLRAQREVSFMTKHWGDVLLKDPFYSPNLTLLSEDFSIDCNRGASHT